MTSRDISNLFFAFLNRSRFNYSLKDIVSYIVSFLCLRRLSMQKRDPHLKKHFLFKKAGEKFANELDAVRIVKTLRKFKMFA